MELRRLEYFLDLVETGNYSETAERMYTTQGNVSKQIMALEKELGVTLFDRSHRRIELTEAGEAVCPYARKLVQTGREMEKALTAWQSARSLVLRIQAIPVLTQYGITELLAEFGRKYPEIQVDVEETEKVYLQRNLEEGLCDVIYSRQFEGEEAQCETIVADRDQFVAVLPAVHPLADRPSLALSELREQSFLMLDEKTELFHCICRQCREAGFEPHITYKGVRIETILGMIASGMGISILMGKTVSGSNRPGIVTVPLARPLTSELIFGRKQGGKHSRAGRIFWEFLREKME